jgi:hypothetical protein
MANPWWNPACSSSPYSADTWDLTPCFQATTLSLVPFAVLGIVGSLAFPSLAYRYKNNDKPEKGGKSAYGVKIVCLKAMPERKPARTDSATNRRLQRLSFLPRSDIL